MGKKEEKKVVKKTETKTEEKKTYDWKKGVKKVEKKEPVEAPKPEKVTLKKPKEIEKAKEPAPEGPKLKPIPAKEKAEEEEVKEGPKLKPIPQKPKPEEATSMGASGSSGTNVVREAAVTKRRTEDLPLEDDQQYFIEPVLPNKIEHALQEESQMSQEKAVDFESTKTHEEQLKESVDLVNMKTPNVMGSSTQPMEGVERVELVAGEKSEAKEEIEESKEKVTLKKGKPKDKENKTTPEKMGGMETVSLNIEKQRNIKDSTIKDGEITRHGDSRNVTEKEEGTKETPAKTKGAAVKDTENHIDQEKPAFDLKERREPKETKKGKKEEEQLRTASAGKTNERIVSEGTSEATRTAKEAT